MNSVLDPALRDQPVESPISKSADRTNIVRVTMSDATRVRKPAIQQTWKSAPRVCRAGCVSQSCHPPFSVIARKVQGSLRLWPTTVRSPHSRNLPVFLALLILLPAFGSPAEDLTNADRQGRALVDQLLAQRPAENYTATGTLSIRAGGGRKTELPIRFDTIVTATNWQSVCQAGDTNQIFRLTIIHAADRPDAYYYNTNSPAPIQDMPTFSSHDPRLAGAQTMAAFADSDFWIADLGLEFFHWPQQKVLKKEIKRSRGCTVLESTNPHPTAGGYARVVSWIDSETDCIVQAQAYDADNQLLKEFYPKDFKKVNGQWQVGMMEMDNDQTDSRSRLEFNLNPHPAQ